MVDIKGESGDQVPWKLPGPWTRSLSTLTCGERLGYFIMQFERKSRESYKTCRRDKSEVELDSYSHVLT